MREYKFRALINKGGAQAKDQIVQVQGILFEKDDLKIAYRTGDGGLRWQRPKAIIEYTGLKDKYGKEIYAHDRIKGYGAGHWFSTDNSEVFFTYYGAYIIMGDKRILLTDFADIEVIGNIYEKEVNEIS